LKKRILYIILGMMLFGNLHGQERFNLNTLVSTPSNDGNYCGRVTFTVFNDNNFEIEIELWQKIPGASTFTSPRTTTTIPPNSSISINSSLATIAGTYSYYAEFTKTDNSILSNTALTPINVIVYPRPLAGNITGTNNVCVGLTTALNSNPSGGSLPYSYTWTSSAVIKGSVVNTGVVTGVEGGTTSISYIVTDSKGCVSPSSPAYPVSVKALPVVTFIEAANQDECQNSEVTYTTQAGKTNYIWVPSGPDYVITNGGLGLTNNTVSLKWLTTGNKRLQVNYTDVNGCTAASPHNSQETMVNPLPAATIASSVTSVCKDGTAPTITFTGSGATSPYVFTYTLNSISKTITTTTGNSVNINVPVNAANSYTYALTGVTESSVTGCSNIVSGTASVTVNPLPAATIASSVTSVCKDGTAPTITFTGSGATSPYVFTYTLNSISKTVTTTTGNSVNVNVPVNTANSYTYALTGVTESSVTGCSNIVSGTASVTVNSLPTKPTLTSQAICEGTTATITGPSGTYTYTWQVPTGVGTSTTKSVSTTKAGTYSLTITDANTCTSEVGIATVTVNSLPAKPTLTSQTICEGQSTSVAMTLPTGTYTYTWTVPTGVATSTTKTVSTTKAGTYSLTITDANTCTSEVGTATVTVNPLPAKPTLTSPKICEGETASVTMLTPTGTNTYTYNWTVPTGVATSTTKTVSTNKAGTYSLTITDANTCTSEVGTATVTVNALPPKPTLTSPVICEGANATVTMSTPTGTNTYTYTWTVATGVATSTSNSVTTTKAGTYSLTITDANTCTSEVGTGIVTVNPIPTFSISSPSVCLGSQLKITANPLTGASTDYNYTWQVPTGVSNPGNVSNFTTTNAGVYTATIKNKTTSCESLSSNAITSFYPLPSAAAIVANNNKVIVNKTLNLTAAASGGKNPYYFTWTPNPTINYSISGQENAVFTALKEGKVKFKYQVKDANNCEAISGEYEITIESEDIILVLPNAFTPNGDGNNDEFKIAATNTLGEKSFVYFEIYNRNGKLLTNKITDIKAGWNGRSLDNVMQDMGVYFVKLVKLDKDGKQVVATTPIYLLK